MKILHISPTYFSDQSIIGGGERYPFELAKAMSRKAVVTYMSFANEESTTQVGNLRVVHLKRNELIKGDPLSHNPLSGSFLKWVLWSNVIHCHQAHTHITNLAIVLGKCLGKRVFVTDLGGGTLRSLSYYLPIFNLSDGFLFLSEYSRSLWARSSKKWDSHHLKKGHVIYGGVDTEKFSPATSGRRKTALFVGRLLPHKGVDYAIESIQGQLSLDVVGRPYRQDYFDLIKTKSLGRNVNFILSADDNELVDRYKHSLVTVTPSVSTTSTGEYTQVPELLCLVALESMASGTPVIATNITSLPELVTDGVTGFLVPPNDPTAIRNKLEYLFEHPEIAESMGAKCRAVILQRFSWDAISAHCLEIYQGLVRNTETKQN